MRETKYDLMKTIAIWLVCCYHFSWAGVDCTYTEISPLPLVKVAIWACNAMGVPLFFIVNGTLLAKKELKLRNHFRKCGLLIIQYMVWRSITILVLALENQIEIFNQDKGIMLQFVNYFFLFEHVEGIDVSHFWFIPVLISIYILCPFLMEKKMENIILLLVLTVTVFVRGNVNHIKYAIPKMLEINLDGFNSFMPITGMAAVMLVYFIIGILIEKYKFDLELKKCSMLFMLGVSWLVLEHMLSVKNGNIYDIVFDSYCSIATIISTTALFLIINKLDNRKIGKLFLVDKIIKVIGKNTLTVYYLHYIIGSVILKYIEHDKGIFINGVKALVMVLVCSIIGEVGRKIPLVRKIIY